MIFFIETHGFLGITLSAITAETVIQKEYLDQGARNLLTVIDLFLNEVVCGAVPIEAIAICTRGESFTASRLTVAIGNAFGYAWNIPVIGFSDIPENTRAWYTYFFPHFKKVSQSHRAEIFYHTVPTIFAHS